MKIPDCEACGLVLYANRIVEGKCVGCGKEVSLRRE